MITPELKEHFEIQGYLNIKGMFSKAEAQTLREHYMELRMQGSKPGDFTGVDVTSKDPLKKFPRMIHMHRWDSTSLDWLLDKRIGAALTGLAGVEAYAVQSMVYYKPPKARGQALHQDQFYLRAQPGTCIAWPTEVSLVPN